MPSRLENINEEKKQALERLRKRGVDPYPNRYRQTHTAKQAVEQLEESENKGTPGQPVGPVSIAGRIKALRKMGKSSFLDLHDGSGKIQLLFRNADFSEYATLDRWLATMFVNPAWLIFPENHPVMVEALAEFVARQPASYEIP